MPKQAWKRSLAFQMMVSDVIYEHALTLLRKKWSQRVIVLAVSAACISYSYTNSPHTRLDAALFFAGYIGTIWFLVVTVAAAGQTIKGRLTKSQTSTA